MLGRAVRVCCRSLNVQVLALFLHFSCGPNPNPVRPRGVPIDAVLIMSTKIGWWQHCAIMAEGQGVQCRIWNGLGLILENEEFLPYDGKVTPRADELRISPDPTFPGPDRIFLTNGRVLLPKSRFERLKKFVDWLNQG